MTDAQISNAMATAAVQVLYDTDPPPDDVGRTTIVAATMLVSLALSSEPSGVACLPAVVAFVERTVLAVLAGMAPPP